MKKLFKRVVLGVLATTLVVQSAMIQTTYADSNKIRQNYVRMKHGQSLVNLDVSELTKEDLRVLALYLSNFYTPFSTVLDGKDVVSTTTETEDEDGESTTEVVTETADNQNSTEGMITALVNSGFEEDTAEALVELVYSSSLETAKPMVFKSNTQEMFGMPTSPAPSVGSRPANPNAPDNTQGIGIVPFATGIMDDIYYSFTTIDEDGYDKVKSSMLRGIRYKQIDGEELPSGYYTATMGTFLSMMHLDISKTFNYWDGTQVVESEVFSTNDSVKTVMSILTEKLRENYGILNSFSTVSSDVAKQIDINSDDSWWNISNAGAKLYVDWVGNILMDTGVERIIVCPAVMNPYVFQVHGSDTPGSRINLVSSFGVDAISTNSVIRVERKNQAGGTDSYSLNRYQFATTSNNVLLNQNYYVGFRGETNNDTSYKLDRYNGTGWGDVGNLALTIFARGMGVADSEYKGATGDSGYTGATDTFDAGTGMDNRLNFPNISHFKLSEPTVSGFPSGKVQLDNGDGRYAFTNVVGYDNINDYIGEDNVDLDSHIVTGSLIITEEGGSEVEQRPLFSSVGGTFATIETNTGSMMTEMSNEVSDRLFSTMLFAYENYVKGGETGTFDESTNKIDMVFRGKAFPTVKDNVIDWASIAEKLAEGQGDKMKEELMSMVYYILHPSEGMKYFSTWAKNKISAFLLGWHEDMVGMTSSNASTGMTKYLGFTGYTTVPNLEDMSWTNWLLTNYNSVIVYLIIIISAIMCCYVIIGSLTAQRALLGAFMFGVLAFLPPLVINASANVINQACDTIYGTKFSYWALVQHQSYLQDLYSATSGSGDTYKNFVLGGTYVTDAGKDAADGTDIGVSSVRLKWMSPKKDNYMASFVQETQEVVGEDSGLSLNLYNMMGSSYSGEDFLNDNTALYLYRDYMNITTYSLKSYHLYSHYHGGEVVKLDSGSYKYQVGYNWSKAGYDADKITYNSGYSFSNMIYNNYEVNYNYNSLKNDEIHQLSSVEHVRRGFMNNTFGGSVDIESNDADYYQSSQLATGLLLNFNKAYDDLYSGYQMLKTDIENGTTQIDKSKLWGYGLPQSYFNFTQSDLSQSSSGTGVGYSKDLLDYFYYGLYSESPYYYMTYNILDQLHSNTGEAYEYSIGKNSNTNIGNAGAFQDLLLGNNLEYFFNYSPNSGDGYGELKDFMNMHDFFYFVLPLMDYGNKLVDDFDAAYGMELYDEIKVRFTKDGYIQVTYNGNTCVIEDIRGPQGETISANGTEYVRFSDFASDLTEEELYKFWHNYNVSIIFNAYSTWADTMYDCNYSKAETIKVAGKEKVVTNPLDPTSYFLSPVYKEVNGVQVEDANGDPIIIDWVYDGRPMVFSKSEMKYYGLEWSDLTTVEQKIITVQENVYERALDLMNYTTFDDDVLLSSYAMLQLFEFNKEFSQTSFVGQSYIMYPQSYELKAFSYDAYLRLIISNATGEDLQAKNNQSLYERTMENTSLTFAILLLLLDIICVYLIPAFKVFFMVAIFFMSIMLIVASAVKIELNMIQVVWKSLVKPALSFTAVSVGLAFIVSLFMSNGAKGVTGELQPTIEMGDPTMVVAVMIVINGIALYLYWKICKSAGKDFIKYAKAVANNIGGTVVGAFKTIGGAALAGGIIKSLSSNGQGSYNAKQSGKDNSPRPITNSSGSGVGSGTDGASSGGSPTGGGVRPQQTGDSHGQAPMSTKPDSEKVNGQGSNVYDSKAEIGKVEREKDSELGKARETGRTKKTLSERSEEAKNNYETSAQIRKQIRKDGDNNMASKFYNGKHAISMKYNSGAAKVYDTADALNKGARKKASETKTKVTGAVNRTVDRTKSTVRDGYNKVDKVVRNSRAAKSVKSNMKSIEKYSAMETKNPRASKSLNAKKSIVSSTNKVSRNKPIVSRGSKKKSTKK